MRRTPVPAAAAALAATAFLLGVAPTAGAVTPTASPVATASPASTSAAASRTAKATDTKTRTGPAKDRRTAKRKVPKEPVGSILLPPQQLKAIGRVVCGRVGGQWHAGTMTRSGRFLTFARQASNVRRDAKRLKGKPRKARLTSAIRLSTKSDAQRTICRTYGRYSTPGVVPMPAGTWQQPVLGPDAPIPTASPTPLRIDLRAARGLAQDATPVDTYRPPGSAPASNLRAVDEAGGLQEAVVSGHASIQRFLIAPNGRAYVLFATRVHLEDTTSYAPGGCLLAEIDRTTTVPRCVDDELAWIVWGSEDQRVGNPAIQFDATGSIYYAGTTADGRTVLRRERDGTRTDLITEFAFVHDFVVLGDGTVILNGSTHATGASWLRRLTPGDALRTLHAHGTSFLREFPDGNVYYGSWETSGIRRYLAEDDAVDPQHWIARSSTAHNDLSPFCGWGTDHTSAVCSGDSVNVQRTFTTTDEKVFAIVGGQAHGELWQYFPTLARPTSAVRRVTRAVGVITNIVLSGLDAQDRNITTIYDTSAATEKVLVGPDAEIEMYHLNYVAESNSIYFDGLRFADNTYVIGRIDLSTNRMTATPVNAGRLAGFETFG